MMANSPKNAGQEAAQKLGWWHSYRFLLLRRLSQILILTLFLLGPLFNIWLADDGNRQLSILRGNYSSSYFLDSIPLTDPLVLIQSISAGHFPELLAVIGGIIIALVYALIASRLFCSWVCPFNLVTDLAAWLRRKLSIRSNTSIPRQFRYGFVIIIIIASVVSGTLIWEWVNPVATFGRGLINGLSQESTLEGLFTGLFFGFGASIWLILVIFFFDLLVTEHGWCGHLCPVGAVYAVLGCKSIMRISASNRQNCTQCMDCINICPEPQVLRTPLFGKKSPLVLDKDCISCGRCIDVCPENVFNIKTRFYESEIKNEK